MSRVAPKKPTIRASIATAASDVWGLDAEIAQSPITISPWVANIHDRLCPSHCVRPGMEVRSSSGAQTNFSA